MAKTRILSSEVLDALIPKTLTFRGACVNIDDTLSTGIYVTNVITLGTFPPKMNSYGKYGILIELPNRNSNRYQMIVGENGAFATRCKYNGVWQSWMEPIYTLPS